MIATLKRDFSFLEKEYGLKYRKVPADRWDQKWTPSASFLNDSTGVLITYDARDQFLTARIYPLLHGQFPMRNGRIDLSKGYPLNSIIFLNDPERRVGDWRSENSRSSKGDLNQSEYISLVAQQLRLFADDLLKGDFSRADAIDRVTAAIRLDAQQTNP